MSDDVNIEVSLESNVDEVKKAAKSAISAALEAVGLKAVGYAALLCPVDTGRLRNSIVYTTDAMDGSDGGNQQEKELASEADMSPNGSPDENTVVIGTNVEYAQDIELGRSKQAPNGFLGPAIQDHVQEYKELFEFQLSQAESE